MSMTPVVNGQDVVRLAARHLFLGQVKCQLPVRDIFFAGSTADKSNGDGNFPCGGAASQSGSRPLMSEYEAAAMTSWFDYSRYSVLFVAQAICRLQDEYKLHAMLDERLVDEQLQAIHDSSEWKKIG